MDAKTQNPRLTRSLAAVSAFQDLSASELQELGSQLTCLSVARGDTLVREGDDADALFLVVSGRFQVDRQGVSNSVAEIAAGHPIGEIAFFSGGVRTASVRAKRDSLVLKLQRDDFERIAARSPAIWRTMTETLSRRLADTIEASKNGKTAQKPRTIAVIQAGPCPIPELFIHNLRTQFSQSRCHFLDSASLDNHPEFRSASPEAFSWFNELEAQFDIVFYLADAGLTPWSEKAIRQADLVLAVGVHNVVRRGAPTENAVERFAFKLHDSKNVVLLLLHDCHGTITGTRHWLGARSHVHRHHHLVISRMVDYKRLARFIQGNAVGLVACGGGSYSAAHIGLYQALIEAGLEFDFVGGSSGGGAMTAAFATGISTTEIDRRVHDIFVRSKAFRRWTWPRYSLLDHTVFDRQLETHFGAVDIEDLWTPYFATSTNLSTNASYYHRHGPLWEAVRATAAIPALLPPFFTAEGDMLVDGSILDNVPLAAMRSIKSGPNVIISFDVAGPQHFAVDYRALPPRNKLIWKSLNPLTRRTLPSAPGPMSVLVRSFMAGCRNSQTHVDADDVLLIPPLPPGLNLMDWRSHSQLVKQAYEYGVAELHRLKSTGHLLLNPLHRNGPPGRSRPQESQAYDSE
jgi:NTE family protein